MFACSSKTRIFLISIRGWHQSGWKEADCGSHLEETDDNVANPHHFFTMYTWEVTQRECKPNEIIFEEYTKMIESRISDGPTEKLQVTVAWFYDMEGHARKCVERYCELANKVEQLYSVSSPCVGDHQFKSEELESDGELSPACSQNVVQCLYLARIGRPDILWSVDKLARAVTKWTQACDRRLARLISYIHHTHDYRQHCLVAQHCRLELFQDSDFAGDLEDSNSTSGGVLCIFGSPSVECARNRRQYPNVPQNLE